MPAKPHPADQPASLQQRLDGVESRLRRRSAHRDDGDGGSPETEVAGVLGMIERPAIIRDRAGRILHANDAAARSAGRGSASDLLGTSADALFPPGGRMRATPVQWHGARCEAVVFEAPDGGAGQGCRLAEAERRLAEAERRLADAASYMSDGLLLWDADDRLVMFNNHFQESPADCPELFRLGMTFREFAERRVRRNWYEGRDRAGLEAALAERERIHREATGSHEIRFAGDRWVLMTERRTAEGFTIGIYTDITERKRRERAMCEAKEAAELANRAKSEFLANMSHELRTPLNAVIGLSEVLKDQLYGPLGSDRYLSYARDIRDSGRHLLRLINDILDLSRIDAGKVSPQPEQFDPRETIESSIRIVRGRREGSDTRIAAEVAPGLAPVRLDERMFKQILSNLLSNAGKFTPEGGRITLAARPWRGDGIEVTVRDTGIGIAKDQIPKIFAPFVQLDTALDRRYQGAGLGLALTKALVELQAGEIEIDSAPGEGTTVTVRLPSAPAEPA